MPELVMACAKLKSLLNNDYAVERYTIMKSKNYTHPDWVKQESKLRGGVNYGRCQNTAR